MGEKQEVEKKKGEGEKKGDGGATTAVFKLDMHCDGCAKKVRRSVKHIDGVESVKADSATNKLTVVGKVEPTKIKEKLEEKTKKKVELISPQPNKPSKEGGGGEKKSDEKKSDEKKSDEKKSEAKSGGEKSEEKKDKPKEPPVSSVLLKTRVHCAGCAHKIQKIVGKYKGVQDVNVDLLKDTIAIKGMMNMKELLPYLNMKLKRVVEVAQSKKDEGGDKKPKEGGSEKPKESGDGGSEKPKDDKKQAGGGDKKKEDKKKEDSGEKKAAASSGGGDQASNSIQENTTRIEVNKMEYGGGYTYGSGGYPYAYGYTYDPRLQGGEGYNQQVVEYWHEPAYSQPPQMFSDENPNACSVM